MPFSGEPGVDLRGQRRAVPRGEDRGELTGQTAGGQHDPMEGEETLDAIDETRAFARQRGELAMQVPSILVGNARDVEHTPDARLAGGVSA